jgi:LAO/AO transport system kinase
VVQTIVLVLAPGLGDEIQAMKAGIMEIADIFVVNKADREKRQRINNGLTICLAARG